MTIASIPLLNSWIELFGVAGLICGGWWAMKTWKDTLMQNHAEVFSQLLATFSSEGFAVYNDLIEKKHLTEITEDSLGKNGEQIERLDRLLMFFNEVCYLKANGLIGDVEFAVFAYPIKMTLENRVVTDYLTGLKEVCGSVFMYEALMDYSGKNGNKNSRALNERALDEYFIGQFGAMTDTARTIKARVRRVVHTYNCSLDDLVSSEENLIKSIRALPKKFPGKSANQVSDLKNAIKHCYKAKTGEWPNI